MSEGLSQHGHVGSRRVADLGHRVDEADLRGEEGVGSDFDELRRGEAVDDDGGAGVEDRSVRLVEGVAATEGAIGVGREAVHEA